MIPRRHSLLLPWLWAAAGSLRPATAQAEAVREGRELQFPRDHGAHLSSRIEWWYATGWLQAEGLAGLLGFQVTFFRSRTGLANNLSGRLAPRHLLFAHAAVTDLQGTRHLHADRLTRWSGQDLPDLRARAALDDAKVAIDGWYLTRSGPLRGSRYDTRVSASGFAFDLQLQASQPVLLQGTRGYSRKGPETGQASHYTSETQVQVGGSLQLDGPPRRVTGGRAWIDHEWSDTLLHPEAVGWDWIGMNLDDGRALMAFQLRRADGRPLWSGGSLRHADGSSTAFPYGSVIWTAGRRWTSAATRAVYPVEWQVQTPAGRWQVRSLLDRQELDGRQSTGTVYWEGLSELLDETGRSRQGLGYLEMTGYASRLVL